MRRAATTSCSSQEGLLGEQLLPRASQVGDQAADRAGARRRERAANRSCCSSGDATDGLQTEHQGSSMPELTHRFKLVSVGRAAPS
jgi:hypothetical protein